MNNQNADKDFVVSAIASIEALNLSDAHKSAAIKRLSEDSKITATSTRLFLECATEIAATPDYAVDSVIFSQNRNSAKKVADILFSLRENRNSIDSYTITVLRNVGAFKNELANHLQNASLCSALEYEANKQLKVRLHKADSTATTQASSTRQALCALGVGEYDARARVLKIVNTESETFKALKKVITKPHSKR